MRVTDKFLAWAITMTLTAGSLAVGVRQGWLSPEAFWLAVRIIGGLSVIAAWSITGASPFVWLIHAGVWGEAVRRRLCKSLGVAIRDFRNNLDAERDSVRLAVGLKGE